MNFYETPDLGLTATFVSLGYPIKGLLTKKGRVYFTFEYSKHLIEMVGKYFGEGVEVNAKTYYYTLRDLKKQIYESQEAKSE